MSGAIYAFNAHLLTRIPHLQAQHVEFLPAPAEYDWAHYRHPRWERFKAIYREYAKNFWYLVRYGVWPF